MKSPAEQFLTAQEQEQINEAVKKAEGVTSGEIVPMIVSASGHYRPSVAFGSLLTALPIAFLCTELLGRSLWLGFSAGIILFVVLTFIFFLIPFLLITRCGKLQGLKKRYMRPGEIEEMVGKSAFAAFYEEKLYATAAENGVLLYISVLEQKAVLLADRGINEKMDQGTWEGIVAKLTEGIKAGRSCEALCTAIGEIGDKLVTHFPVQKDDVDELHNLIIRP